ncbi:hypothetical protein JB92DRAFT_2906529 [Gautieria morchelliformis]|nr:hypothetical protein JB92DRAFT_2906529 [Gautieria morchelliformis]
MLRGSYISCLLTTPSGCPLRSSFKIGMRGVFPIHALYLLMKRITGYSMFHSILPQTWLGEIIPRL